MSEALVVLLMLFGWFVAITLAALIWRAFRGRPSSEDVAREELRARDTRRELSHGEYERQRARLPAEPEPARKVG